MMWVRLRSIQYVSENGRTITKHPGEWIRVGRQQATSWLATGEADRPDMPDLDALPGCGVVLTGGSPSVSLSGLEMVKADKPRLEFARTLLWSGINFRGDLLAAGFRALDAWELAVPLLSYETLARDVGSDEDRGQTEKLVRDLRVPLYDVRLMFVHRSAATRRLLDAWLVEEGDRSLAFLRALYRIKPLMLALPTTWVLP